MQYVFRVVQRITKILDHYILTYLVRTITIYSSSYCRQKAQSGKTTCNIDLRSAVLKTGLSLNCKQSNKINNIMLSRRQRSIEFQINPIDKILYQIST